MTAFVWNPEEVNEKARVILSQILYGKAIPANNKNRWEWSARQCKKIVRGGKVYYAYDGKLASFSEDGRKIVHPEVKRGWGYLSVPKNFERDIEAVLRRLGIRFWRNES